MEIENLKKYLQSGDYFKGTCKKIKISTFRVIKTVHFKFVDIFKGHRCVFISLLGNLQLQKDDCFINKLLFHCHQNLNKVTIVILLAY